jgi:sugar O-acyltransferase (sialic acid O-acetyltransferase NeuD family)
MKKLVIIGVGGFGREVLWLVERINKVEPTWDILGFVDDNESVQHSIIDSYPVLGNCDWLRNQKDEIYAICAIGASKVRKNVIQKLCAIRYATIIDPSVIMSDKISIGMGCILCAGTIITVGISLGSHTIVNLDCTIGHDAVLNDFVTLYPSVNISGNTILEECVEMGTGAQIIQGISICKDTIVGAGAVVVKNITETGTYIGVPARRL